MGNKPYIQIEFTTDEINTSTASDLPQRGCGGVCVFIGQTRPAQDAVHGDLLALQYDCYKDMAYIELNRIAKEALNQFSIHCIRITHSLGTVPVSKASVVIAVGCDHRDEAFTTCQFLIDTLKNSVPIWKKEIWSRQSTWSKGTLLEQPIP